MKKGSSGKNLYIILFACLFHCSRLNDTRIMTLCLRKVEMILCNQFFFTDLVSVCSEEKWYKEKYIQ